MANSSFPSTTKVVIGLCGLAGACASNDDDESRLLRQGAITYPFVQDAPIGVNGRGEKFVLRSIASGTEYVVEIPAAGEDYDIEIPLAAFDPSNPHGAGPRDLPSPVKTDRELVDALPSIERERPTKSALLDKAFGVGNPEGPTQSPSYTMQIAKVNQLYQSKNYEYALIELNHLLSFYPQSPRLHKMKGTIYVKMQNYSLAERSWTKALELNPNDRTTRASLERLRARMRKIFAPTGPGEQREALLERERSKPEAAPPPPMPASPPPDPNAGAIDDGLPPAVNSG